MLVLLSPAKSMNSERDLPDNFDDTALTVPTFVNDAAKLIKDLQNFDASEISNRLNISEALGQLNFDRYQEWAKSKKPSKVARPAIALFDGDVYRGFNVEDANTKQLVKANEIVRILSGLYGLIKPLDVINPYRLEMGSDVQLVGTKNLYDFWSPKIASQLRTELSSSPGDQVIINLASNEYFKAVDKATLDTPTIAPKFLDQKPGKEPKIISFYAKVARGAMARWIADTNSTAIDQLSGFRWEGYKFSKSESTATAPTFIRKHKD